MSTLVKNVAGALTVSLDLLNKVQIRNTRRKFELGEDLVLTDTGRTETIEGQEFPIFNMGPGRDVDLQILGNFYIADEKLTGALKNVGTPEECLDREFKPTLVIDWMKENEGRVPKSLKVVSRVSAGAKQEYVADPETGAVRKAGYKLAGIDCTGEDFPALFLRKGKDPKVKENWRAIDRLTFQIAE